MLGIVSLLAALLVYAAVKRRAEAAPPEVETYTILAGSGAICAPGANIVLSNQQPSSSVSR